VLQISENCVTYYGALEPIALTGDQALDFDLIGQIRTQVLASVPLVLHGSSGVPGASLG
jgi:fructose/tagatose bisphosphate aldolase